tara:strand:- start:60 stop:263 length:204 start_codon:yes stop_codon:yes gene_type:complete
MKVGDLVKVVGHYATIAPQRSPFTTRWHGQHGIIVEIHNHRGNCRHCIVLTSGDKKWFDLDELELVE